MHWFLSFLASRNPGSGVRYGSVLFSVMSAGRLKLPTVVAAERAPRQDVMFKKIAVAVSDGGGGSLA